MDQNAGDTQNEAPVETGIALDERRRRIAALKQELVGGDLFAAAEVAEILDIHPRTVGEYIRDGKLRAFQFGGGWKISESAIRAFVQEQTQVPAPAGPRDGGSMQQALSVIAGAATRLVGNRPAPHAYKCSFCGKPQERVERLIAGPNRVYICNECVDLCNGIIAQEKANSSARG